MTDEKNTNQLKLLSVSRQGEGVPVGKVEFEIALSVRSQACPWSGSLKVLIDDKDAKHFLGRSFEEISLRVLSLLLDPDQREPKRLEQWYPDQS